MEKNKVLGLLFFLSVIPIFFIATYASAYYHETLNVALDKSYGINSTIAFFLPFSHQTSSFWQGSPNKTTYTISETIENQVDLNTLANNSTKYTKWEIASFSIENNIAQQESDLLSLIPVFIWTVIATWLGMDNFFSEFYKPEDYIDVI